MPFQHEDIDQLYLIAESLATDFSLFADRESTAIEDHVQGLLPASVIDSHIEALARLDTDAYCERCVAPAESAARPGVREIVPALGAIRGDIVEFGPFYSAVVVLEIAGREREVGVIAQNRAVRNGVWEPEHHLAAAERIEVFSRHRLPVVGFMDTPGADAGENANRHNQAHSISRLIAEMCNLDVPTVGIIAGLGYSGGAIPLAACNLLLSVRDGVFNTIQPRGLASIAHKYNLSWQECARQVGVSAYELYRQGNIDGIIDFVPGEDERVDNLRRAIATGIERIEARAREFVAATPYIRDHYARCLERYLAPPARVTALETGNALTLLAATPTEFSNVFGITYRYLRYLGLRKRIRCTTRQQYGRLAAAEVPRGDLADRAERERRSAFLGWLQDSEKLVYDEGLARAWKNYRDKRETVDEGRGRFAQLIFGEPRSNLERARTALILEVTTYLYNRWKNDAAGNFTALIEHLREADMTRALLRGAEIAEPIRLLARIRVDDHPLACYLREHFTPAGRKLLSRRVIADKSTEWLRQQLALELNGIFTSAAVRADPALGALRPQAATADDAVDAATAGDTLRLARRLLRDTFGDCLAAGDDRAAIPETAELTVLDVLLDGELREDFVGACADLLVFDGLYDQLVLNLDTIAAEANATRAIAAGSMEQLLDRCLARTGKSLASLVAGDVDQLSNEMVSALRERVFAFLERLARHARPLEFLKTVEEWKKAAFPRVSDALLVIVTVLLEGAIPSYQQALHGGRRYDGRLNPRKIGRRKDFWNRLTIAYHDLQIQNVLSALKQRRSSGSAAFVERFFEDFEELFGDFISADPVGFPGFRVSIEQALAAGISPSGVITGIGDFRGKGGPVTCGAVISNIDFQAGAFDMASADKVCHLLVACAERRLPVLCFISSGGMQTKEGAGALFSMAVVNDRITRFVLDMDLPVIVFGFGDCTGGAQASFVTHPLVHTYYFSCTNMPFAGQIVVPANLTSHSTLSNYLSQVPGAMQGLVRHPFAPGLDDELRRVDALVPVPMDEVEDVVGRILAGSFAHTPAVATAPDTAHADPARLVRPVRRTLVHARGCTAVKLIRVAQRLGIEVVLVQSDPDMDSVAVDMLGERDRVVCIGGNTSDESYLNGLSVVRVAEHEQVDSMHPGIGFLSENSQFAALCRSHGINFIGPTVEAMEAMGNKSNAINTARRLGVPVVPGSHGILTSVERAAEVADEIGYPVLIKAVHGGGGKGIQVVERATDFHDLFRQVAAEARSAFGNGDVYLEKFITSLRHIEVQILRDVQGHSLVVGLRDCSVQRNKQKLVEESASAGLPGALRDEVFRHTIAIADEVGYVGAGTVEYIYDRASNAVYFMEMNTRLQVEHPVTEKVSGIDIVAAQFRIASGGSIADLEVGDEGYAIEVRINAEKLVRNESGEIIARPDPGTVRHCHFPQRADIDTIACVASGKTVSPFYDSLIAQVIVHGPSREAAAARLADYLDDVRIEGLCTNIPLLRCILRDEVFLAGDYDTAFLDGLFARIDGNALIDEIEAAASTERGRVDVAALRIDGTDELKVLAPAAGIFFITPSPSEPEYVTVGDVIGVDTTLCQLEAMKMFTPLRLGNFNAPEVAVYPPGQHYVITRINIANGQQVNPGDLLFVVRPTDALESAA